jgi:hypothetical protein
MAAETPSLLPHEQPLPPRKDLWIAAVFFVLGVAISWLAFRMPTYADQKGEIYTAPGLVPGFYGVVIVLLSIWLAVRAVRQGALHTGDSPVPASSEPQSNSDGRLALAAGLGLFFVVGLLGRVPFWIASATFAAPVTILCEWQADQAWPVRARRIGEAVLLGLATGAAVTLVFEKVFYVRLP